MVIRPTAQTSPPARGPRGDTLETVLTAAFRILISEGAHALTPQRVHRETGIARTTIYRNWPTTGDLIATMLERATGDQDLAPFTGNLEADLLNAVDGLVFRFNHRPLRPLFGALVEHGRHGSETDIAADYINGVLSSITRVITEGVDRGDLAVDDIDGAVLELAGPLLTKHVLLGQTISEEEREAEAAVQQFLSRYATTG